MPKNNNYYKLDIKTLPNVPGLIRSDEGWRYEAVKSTINDKITHFMQEINRDLTIKINAKNISLANCLAYDLPNDAKTLFKTLHAILKDLPKKAGEEKETPKLESLVKKIFAFITKHNPIALKFKQTYLNKSSKHNIEDHIAAIRFFLDARRINVKNKIKETKTAFDNFQTQDTQNKNENEYQYLFIALLENLTGATITAWLNFINNYEQCITQPFTQLLTSSGQLAQPVTEFSTRNIEIGENKTISYVHTIPRFNFLNTDPRNPRVCSKEIKDVEVTCSFELSEKHLVLKKAHIETADPSVISALEKTYGKNQNSNNTQPNNTSLREKIYSSKVVPTFVKNLIKYFSGLRLTSLQKKRQTTSLPRNIRPSTSTAAKINPHTNNHNPTAKNITTTKPQTKNNAPNTLFFKPANNQWSRVKHDAITSCINQVTGLVNRSMKIFSCRH